MGIQEDLELMVVQVALEHTHQNVTVLDIDLDMALVHILMLGLQIVLHGGQGTLLGHRIQPLEDGQLQDP